MPKRLILYKCKYCNKISPTTKERVLTHEKYCFKNPKNKACLTCIYFKRRYLTLEEREYFRGYAYECSKLDIKSVRSESSAFNFKLSTNKKIDEINYVFDFEDRKLKFPTKNCEFHKRKLIKQ